MARCAPCSTAMRRREGQRRARQPPPHRAYRGDHPDDIPRFAELGVIASMQPPHPPGAMGFPLEPTVSRIGRERWPLCLCLAHAEERRRPCRLRLRLAGLADRPDRGHPGGDHCANPGQTTPDQSFTLDGGDRRLHGRRRLCRIRRGPQGPAEAGLFWPIWSCCPAISKRRPRTSCTRCAR